jgi:hypothetical protein
MKKSQTQPSTVRSLTGLTSSGPGPSAALIVPRGARCRTQHSTGSVAALLRPALNTTLVRDGHPDHHLTKRAIGERHCTDRTIAR